MNSHTANNLITVFDRHMTQPIDRKFMLRVMTHTSEFVRRDENAINFFGGNLIGVYSIKWTTDDRYKWLEDVLEIEDYDELTREVHNLEYVDKINIVSSDVVNLSFLYITYKALTSELLSEKDRGILAHSTLNMMQYKMLSSIHSHNFKYPANIEIALAVYEALDYKSQLKKQGSWQGLIDARSEDILGHDGLHRHTIRALSTDLDVVKMVNDIWNRLKSIVKILTNSFHHILTTNARIGSVSKTMLVNGDAVVKDSFNKYAHIKNTMHTLVTDRNLFIRDELLNVISMSVTTVYLEYLKDTLRYISENYMVKHHQVDLPLLVDDILMYAFTIIHEEKIPLHDLPSIAIKIRGVLRSSRVLSPQFLSIKDRVGKIILVTHPKMIDVNISSTRIALILYICLRALLVN